MSEASIIIDKLRALEDRLQLRNPFAQTPLRLVSSRSLGKYVFGPGRSGDTLIAGQSGGLEILAGDAYALRAALQNGSVEAGIAVDDGHFKSFDSTLLSAGHFVLSESLWQVEDDWIECAVILT